MTSMKDSLKESAEFNLPVGYHKESQEMVLLKDVIDQLDILQPINELDQAQQEKLVTQRWNAGHWEDIIYCQELITADRALKEVQEKTELGQECVRMSLSGLEMKLERLKQSN